MTARKRHHLAAAVGLLAGSACGPAPVAIRTTGPSATTATMPPEATTTTEAPTTTLAPEVEAPPASPLTTSGAGATTTPTTVRRTTTTEAAEAASGACGGALPPCSVMRRESGGDPTAVNATGCGGRGCYGKWQADPRTSRSLGYELTMDQYPEAVQDEFAAALWDNGRGCSHWNAC